MKKVLATLVLLSPVLVFLLHQHYLLVLALAILIVLPLNAFAFSTVYHKLFSHRAFKPKPWVPYVGTLIAVLLLLPSPRRFATLHRMHHKYSDTEHDPHSPVFGKLKTYFPYYFPPLPTPNNVHKTLGKDIDRDYPLLSKFTDSMAIGSFIIFNVLLFAISIDAFAVSITVVCINLHLHGYANTFFHKVNPDNTVDILDIPLGARFVSPEFNHATHHEKASNYDFSNENTKDWMAPIIKKYLSV